MPSAPRPPGPSGTSLAEVLAADRPRFDDHGREFDILERAVLTVLEARPDSRVKVLTDGDTRIPTAQGERIEVIVSKGRVFLGDRDNSSPNPQVVDLDINRGNKQVGHAINRVLRPADL